MLSGWKSCVLARWSLECRNLKNLFHWNSISVMEPVCHKPVVGRFHLNNHLCHSVKHVNHVSASVRVCWWHTCMCDMQWWLVHSCYCWVISCLFTDDEEALIKFFVGRRRATHWSILCWCLREGNMTDIRHIPTLVYPVQHSIYWNI